MKIALRTSGGRGEYELVGMQGNVSSTDLRGIPIFFELTPSLVIPGNVKVKTDQGKPRLRLEKPRNDLHLALLLADILLFPLPKRELSKTGKRYLEIKTHQFAITDVQVDIADRSPSSVVLRPTSFILQNSVHERLVVDFNRRMSRILIVWDAAKNTTSRLASLIQQHRHAVTSNDCQHSEIKNLSGAIRKHLKNDVDILPLVETALKLDPDLDVDEWSDEAGILDFYENDPTTQIEAKRRQIRELRKLAIRGSAGQRFRKKVREAYQNRCLFSGLSLPKLPGTSAPGVDAAHILPWAEFDIEEVCNGICLSKICHWAFDVGILRLEFEDTNQSYRLRIPDDVRGQCEDVGLDLNYFESLTCQIPKERLPKSKKDWPNPRFLNQLYDRFG
ncbi:MAG: hypothetical protein HC901_00770 [Bdellovibrionaceae bacterium]|nr:hypothetical protein [Pseudobdellovibrionaceae bacterium]